MLNFLFISFLIFQFEDNIMDICFEVLDNSREALKNSEMDMERRSDPVYISRMITAMVTPLKPKPRDEAHTTSVERLFL